MSAPTLVVTTDDLDPSTLSVVNNKVVAQDPTKAPNVLGALPTPDTADIAEGDTVLQALGKLQSQLTTVEHSFLVITQTELTSTFYYYGGLDGNNQWKINRYVPDSLTKVSATAETNPTITTLVDAWAGRASLIYA